ncbi:MAG: type II secretion system protein, partial [Patescibacteria group bacterium]
MKKNTKKGLSLIEILVTVTVFTILGVLVTSSVFLTLRSTNKSNSTIKIRDNVNYFLSTIQRQLRGAQAIVNCPNSDDTS